MRSFLPFVIPFATAAFAIPLETTSIHLGPRAACPTFQDVEVIKGNPEDVYFKKEHRFGAFKKGCMYESDQTITIYDQDLDVNINSTIDLIRPYNKGLLTVKEIDSLKRLYWVLMDFEENGSTWVMLLRGSWQPLKMLEGYQKLAESYSLNDEDCKNKLDPIVKAVTSYSNTNVEQRPTPSLDKYLFFEALDDKDQWVVKAKLQNNVRWSKHSSGEEYSKKFRDDVDQQVKQICMKSIKKEGKKKVHA
ncbi:hypothetical protein FRC02_003206 [Tulasnella sp. 418]|nr:hypothetical protein FRC02_003206 [Tulasnella sp. 418]